MRSARFLDEQGSDFPEWEQKKLGEVLELCRSGMSSTQNLHKKGYPVTRIETISTGKINMSKVGYVETDDSIESYLLKSEDILFSNINSIEHIGKTAIVSNSSFPLYHGMNLLLLRADSDTSGTYLFHYLNSETARKYFRKIANKAVSQASINQTEVAKTLIPLPSIAEQKKIAEFFSALDERIELVDNKVRLLKEQKKGYLQRVFAQEMVFTDDNGDTFPEWEQKKLGEVAENLDNQRIPISSGLRIAIKGDIPYYGATGVVDYINDFIFDEDLILLGEDGVDFENFADKPIAQFIEGKSWVNNHAHVFRAKTQNITSKFLYYSLAHKDVTKYVVGGGRAKLNKGEALKIGLNLPSLPEQEKISEFFSALDEQIELNENKLALLKEQKKGYLQGIFG